MARLAATSGVPDPHGWPGTPSLLPHYRQAYRAAPLAVELVDGVTIGNVHALPHVLADVDAVVSLCRMGR